MIKRALLLLAGILVVVLTAEIALRALPVSTATKTGYYLAPNILNYPPWHEWTAATGWDLRNAQRLRSNNMGFAAEHDFVAGSNAVGLIGDSYVEASMLPLAARPAAQLERALNRRLVYAMGGPGSSLLDYAERIDWAQRTLGLKTFVVLMEHVDASQVICGSGNVHAKCLLPDSLEPVIRRLPPSGLLKDVLRESALAQYLNSQLRLKATRLTSADFWSTGTPDKAAAPSLVTLPSVPAGLSPRQLEIIDSAVEAFLRQIESLESTQVVFVIDMNRRNLESGVNQPDEGHYLAKRLAGRGQVVVQAEPLFREHQRQSPLRLDVGPYDAHLNRMGVTLLMQAVAKAIPLDMTNAKGN